MGWEETGHIEVKEGYCDNRACGNNYYLTACGYLVERDPTTIDGHCSVCGKPIQEETK